MVVKLLGITIYTSINRIIQFLLLRTSKINVTNIATEV